MLLTKEDLYRFDETNVLAVCFIDCGPFCPGMVTIIASDCTVWQTTDINDINYAFAELCAQHNVDWVRPKMFFRYMFGDDFDKDVLHFCELHTHACVYYTDRFAQIFLVERDDDKCLDGSEWCKFVANLNKITQGELK